ncbi:MAG: carboxypeptidase regulatory-like domain-containing protein, partial [Vicinamibacterales bacterium]
MCVLLIAAGLAMRPTRLWAQESGSIAGSVRDTTGAMLPGVTVEAASPALIEKVRSVVTDETGQYRLVDLRPGTYSVTFTLPGFSTIKRDGVQLTAGFTANIVAELRVGEVTETITVSGASPLVDVQNVNQQRVMTREVLDAIPTGKQFTALAQLVPGVNVAGSNGQVNQDVGGITGMSFALATIHGGKEDDQTVRINGMSIASLTSIGNARTNLQDGTIEEYGMQMAAAPAEFPYGGIYVNVIPRQGSNVFHGNFFASGTNEDLQTNNLDDDLKRRGLAYPNAVRRVLDVNPSFGGPIVKDKLWFYAGFRYLETSSYVGGLFYPRDPAAWVYEPDTTRPAINDQDGKNESLNGTFQISPKNRLTGFYNYDFQCYCHFGINPNQSPEASHFMKSRAILSQGTWVSTLTNRLLLEVGTSRYFNDLPRDEVPGATQPRITEQATGLSFRAQVNYPRNSQVIWHHRASIAYVTGSHAFKAGFSFEDQYADDKTRAIAPDVIYRTLNGIPNLVTFQTTPYVFPVTLNPIAYYAQDQWTVRRWTVNAGFRFDQFRSHYDDIDITPTRWLPVSRQFPGRQVLDWKDFSPRLGVAYDVFGDGRTAIKATLNRFVLQEGKLQTSAVHPVIAATNTLSRTWTDANGDRVFQGDPFNPAANGELGPSPNVNFGQPTAILSLDQDWATGFGTRPYQWETTVSVQHELMPRLSVLAGYFQRNYGNFIVTDNVLVSPSDYDPFCVTAPVDSRLPGGGGQQICGLYDLNPSKLGQVQQLRTRSSDYGNQYERFNGFDVTMNSRMANGFLLQGGLSMGRRMTDNCDVVDKVDNPSQYLCRQVGNWLPQLKFLGTYPLPWQDIQLSGTFQRTIPEPAGGARFNGMGMSAQYTATNAVIRPSLGRNLSAGANANANVELLEPGL